jgi:hypothetical protein
MSWPQPDSARPHRPAPQPSGRVPRARSPISNLAIGPMLDISRQCLKIRPYPMTTGIACSPEILELEAIAPKSISLKPPSQTCPPAAPRHLTQYVINTGRCKIWGPEELEKIAQPLLQSLLLVGEHAVPGHPQFTCRTEHIDNAPVFTILSEKRLFCVMAVATDAGNSAAAWTWILGQYEIFFRATHYLYRAGTRTGSENELIIQNIVPFVCHHAAPAMPESRPWCTIMGRQADYYGNLLTDVEETQLFLVALAHECIKRKTASAFSRIIMSTKSAKSDMTI